MRRLIVTLCLTLLMARGAAAQSALAPAPEASNRSPAFLPPWFAPALALRADSLHLVQHTEKDKASLYAYASTDQVVNLTVEQLPCDNASCPVVYQNASRYLDQVVTQNAGRFVIATDTEFRADWQSGLGDNTAFVFLLPRGVLFWSYTARLDRKLGLDARFKQLLTLVDRLRYEQARALDNVELGRWAPQLFAYAQALLALGMRGAALPVLQAVVTAMPSDYEAQLDLATASQDAAQAHNSAQAVFDNAEDPVLTARAARLLGIVEPTLETQPVLQQGAAGLQLMLVPLPPCDIRLVEQAGAVFQRATDVPVRVARLRESWSWGVPERIADQKAIQQTLLQQMGPTADFSGWTEERYAIALMDTVRSKDALSRYFMQSFVNELPHRPRQYKVDAYLNRFLATLATYRGTDRRTMYVGVTGANIYSGENNYIFSLYDEKQGRGGSILSYAMMTAKLAQQPFESRRRLIERLAKETVPASLKSLGIPRPADPTDPYSYSSGLDRLDQKTLLLSPPTRAALDKFR